MATKRKVISIGSEAREKLIKGANYLGDAIKTTLGPFGQNFLLEKGNGVTNDGVSIAREMECLDEIEHRGLHALREAAIKTNDEAGDGTTTAITLGQAILKESSKFIGGGKLAGAQKSPSELINQIEKERVEITEKLIGMSVPIKTREQLINSARVSVEDEALGEMIGGMQFDLGKEGIILAEETNERKCSIKKVKGVRVDNGLGTALVMNNAEKQSLEVEKVATIITSHTITGIAPLLPILNQLIARGQRKVIVMGRAFTNEAIQDFMENLKAGNQFFPLNAPYTDMNEVMKDMVAVLGGTYVNAEAMGLANIQLSDVGMAGNVVARRYDSTFTGIEDEKSQGRINRRLEELKAQHKGSESEFEKKNLDTRISQLTNGFALLEVGANSDIERKRLKDKCDDAVNAVRAAFQEGTVDGAGLAFKQIADTLPDTYILKQPLYAINNQIMGSAPKDFQIEDWVKDPVKVLRIALEKACGVASTLATAGGVITTERDKPLDLLLRKPE